MIHRRNAAVWRKLNYEPSRRVSQYSEFESFTYGLIIHSERLCAAPDKPYHHLADEHSEAQSSEDLFRHHGHMIKQRREFSEPHLWSTFRNWHNTVPLTHFLRIHVLM